MDLTVISPNIIQNAVFRGDSLSQLGYIVTLNIGAHWETAGHIGTPVPMCPSCPIEPRDPLSQCAPCSIVTFHMWCCDILSQ